MIYMQDEDPDGWCIYDGTECLFSGLEEDTACIIVSKMNAKQAEIDTLRAENTRLREALAKYADHDNWCVYERWSTSSAAWLIDGDGWEIAEAALANETPTV